MFGISSSIHSSNPSLVWCSQAHVPLLHLAHVRTGPGWLHDHVLPDQPHLHLRRSGPDAGSHHPAAHPLPALHLGVHLAGLDLPPGKREMGGWGVGWGFLVVMLPTFHLGVRRTGLDLPPGENGLGGRSFLVVVLPTLHLGVCCRGLEL